MNVEFLEYLYLFLLTYKSQKYVNSNKYLRWTISLLPLPLLFCASHLKYKLLLAFTNHCADFSTNTKLLSKLLNTIWQFCSFYRLAKLAILRTWSGAICILKSSLKASTALLILSNDLGFERLFWCKIELNLMIYHLEY